nr:unnamed protein product [Digitaria exilis]
MATDASAQLGWSSLPVDLVNRVADCLLATNDLDYYMDLRAVCHGWRSSTADPKNSHDDPRYRPDRWIMLHPQVLNEDPFVYLNSMGYPKMDTPTADDLVLVNNFEDTFGDIYGGGVWSELSETVASNISQNVVSLASFYGEKRIFACTGFFIEWNGCVTILTSASLVSDFVVDKKIAENLRIEVLLSNEEHRVGALQHYNLHYNVALVNVKDFCAPHPANIQQQKHNRSDTLAAIGRCFESGILMAARGRPISDLGRFDCKLLQYTTCTITEVNISLSLSLSHTHTHTHSVYCCIWLTNEHSMSPD